MSKSTYILLSIIAIMVGTFLNYAQVDSGRHADRGYSGGSSWRGYSGSGGHK